MYRNMKGAHTRLKCMCTFLVRGNEGSHGKNNRETKCSI